MMRGAAEEEKWGDCAPNWWVFQQGDSHRGAPRVPPAEVPRGEIFGGGTVPTFMGVMSHAGNEPRGFGKRDFVVSGFYY